ncbi:MAG: 4Fe-4S ferredoxin [Acidobacteria bacterium]|nr:4Fe-4S ferredoxin [Acidobacteriota bacterium]
MDVDVVCAGFGPATGGFLTTLGRALTREDGGVRLESRVSPGMPLQVMCFERADDFGVGVSGVVTRARGLRASFPDFERAQIPLCTRVTGEKLVYLLDPIGASRRSRPLRAIDVLLRGAGRVAGVRHHAVVLPFMPSFLRKHDGFVLSIGQFGQWLSGQIMAGGGAQIWPASPVDGPLFDGDSDRVAGVRLVDQGTDLKGEPTSAYTPGMDVRAALTVVGDGPVGAVGRALDARFGLPEGHARDQWALGMKMVVDLREGVDLEPGTVIHTFGFPEPEIFGFLYVLKPGTVSLGIFVPSWFDSPVRTAYRYLQHWMQHPYLWRWLEGGSLRSWGAKSLQESGRRGEPHLVGDGYARIGEGSGSTNALTGSGVDEAWTTGAQLAEAVIELAERGDPFTRENLERTYVRRRRASWLDLELRIAESARNGFARGMLWGMFGMGLAGLTGGRLRLPRMSDSRRPQDEHCSSLDEQGWPAIVHDGRLLVTHQDALLMGGKVRAAPGYADHVRIKEPGVCRDCRARVCVSMCSGQAITSAGAEGIAFDREKCVHCGACVWNCATSNLEFRAGAGGLHSVEN